MTNTIMISNIVIDTKPLEKITGRKITRKCRNVQARITNAPVSHAADAITSEADINRIISYLMEKHMDYSAALFVTGINVGCRCGDLLSLRVKDLLDINGKCLKNITLVEDKTNKPREIFLNEAVATTLEWLVRKKRLNPENYIFRGNGNRKAYFCNYVYDTDGNVINIQSSGERYNPDGTERQLAPQTIQNVMYWLKKTTGELGIEGHYSSHAMRKTFVEFISRDWNDNRNAVVASAALNHANVGTTIDYYMGINPQRLREKWLGLNLGLSAIKEYIK